MKKKKTVFTGFNLVMNSTSFCLVTQNKDNKRLFHRANSGTLVSILKVFLTDKKLF